MTNYKTFEISYQKLDGLGFVEVVAIDMQAAIADAREAGFEIVCVTQK